MHLTVIGGGPAGISAALQGRALGADVTLVERGRVGGTIDNDGPAPVRALARTARLMRDARAWETFGLRGTPPRVDMRDALENAFRVANYSRDIRGMSDYIRGCGVTLIEHAGSAVFADEHHVRVEDGDVAGGRLIQGDAFVICVGGHAARLDIPGVELARTYEDIRHLDELPERVVIIGGNDTGCQLASILADFGAEVTIIEFQDHLKPGADLDLSRGLEEAFGDRGMRLELGAQVLSLSRVATPDGAISVVYSNGEVVADAVFLAVGWPGNSAGLGLEELGIDVDRGSIVVDSTLRTAQRHIFAAGDITGRSMLVPSARSEGRIAAENAVLNTQLRCHHVIVPTGSFTDPEYGSVGLTEEQAAQSHNYEVGVIRYRELLRPVADSQTDGFCKIIVDADRLTILGAHVLGEYSAELIQMVAACMVTNMRVDQLAELPFAFPTFTEAVGMAAQQVVRKLGLAHIAQHWSDLSHPGDATGG